MKKIGDVLVGAGFASLGAVMALAVVHYYHIQNTEENAQTAETRLDTQRRVLTSPQIDPHRGQVIPARQLVPPWGTHPGPRLTLLIGQTREHPVVVTGDSICESIFGGNALKCIFDTMLDEHGDMWFDVLRDGRSALSRITRVRFDGTTDPNGCIFAERRWETSYFLEFFGPAGQELEYMVSLPAWHDGRCMLQFHARDIPTNAMPSNYRSLAEASEAMRVSLSLDRH
jgi:hypothetical protein